MRAKNSLILFTKTAQICRVKTRMWPDLSYGECLRLHKVLTADAINKFSFNNNFNLIIYTTHTKTMQHISTRGITIKKQYGLDLGSRMSHAINQELTNSQQVVLIGSDCPTLNVNYINKAFKQLSTINDVVLGPTKDGGYALIGMKKKKEYLFKNISWGTSNVFTQTLQAASNNGCNIKSLAVVSDIDTIKDLQQLKKTEVSTHLG